MPHTFVTAARRPARWALACLLAAGTAMAAHAAPPFTLPSPAFAEGSTLPQPMEFDGLGCAGENQSPPLQWSGAPAGTQSYAVTMYDPDAPTGSGWWHWLVANLPADTRVLPQGAGSGQAELPEEAIQTRTDFGLAGYGGAAPPKGETHRYIFTVHALDVEKIAVDEGASGAMVGFNVHFHSLGSASITALFS